MGIIVILVALVVPALNGLSGGNRLTDAGSAVVAQLNVARQLALAEGQEIEVRFYKLPGETGTTRSYRALQRFRVSDGTALDKILRLPNPIVISDTAKFSTLLTSANGGPTPPTATVSGTTGVEYRTVRFRSSGSTTLDPRGASAGSDRWFLTLANENDLVATTSADRPANNFITVQVDPVTGRTRAFQP